MKTSTYVRIIENSTGYALCYHSLLGNLFLLDPEHVQALRHHQDQVLTDTEIKQSSLLSDLRRAHFIEKDSKEARDLLLGQNEEWASLLPGGGRVHFLNLIVSEACNFGCPHCLHRCSLEGNNKHGAKKLMDLEMARLAIDGYTSLVRSQNPEQQLSVHFGSAEPLLNWTVVLKSADYVRGLDPNAKLSINTNLSLVTPEIAATMLQMGMHVATSLDGPVGGNDAIRFYPDGSGTYTDIMRAFGIMNNAGNHVDGFSVTINDLNFEHIDDKFADWAVGQGFKGIATDIDLVNMENAHRSIDECVQRLISFRQACMQRGMENHGSWTTIYDYLVNGCDDKITTFCKAARGRNISVNPEGKIFMCGHSTTVLGDIHSLAETLANGSPYIELITSRLPGNNPECYGCRIEGLCSGQCHITREIAQRNPNNRFGYLCKFFQEVTDRLLEVKLDSEIASLSAEEVIIQ